MTEDEEKVFDVSPEEGYIEDRSRWTIFWQVLGRKFWKLMSTNLMFVIFNIPAIAIAAFIASVALFYLPQVNLQSQNEPLVFFMMGTFPLFMFIMTVPAITTGPAQAGLTYLLRCFSYEMPTFYWSDFKDKMRDNLKQGFLVSLINLVATLFLILDFYLYSQFKTASLLLPVANGIMIVVFLLFLMMNLYIYPMMVTYNLKLKDLYKNAFLFASAKFLPNLLILILCFLLIIVPVLIVNLTGNVLILTIVYFYYALLGFSLPGYIINFMVNPIIDKYMSPDERENQAR